MALSAPTNANSAQGNASTTIDAAFLSNVTAGNTLIVLVAGYSVGDWGASAISKQAGTATLGTITQHLHPTNNPLYIAAYSAPITGSGSLTIRATATNAGQYPTIAIYEQPGGVTYDAGNSGSGVSASHATGAASNTTADAIGYVVDTHGGATATPTLSSGWTLGQVKSDASYQPIATGYQLFATAASRSATFTWENNSYLAGIVLFKAAGGAQNLTRALVSSIAHTAVAGRQAARARALAASVAHAAAVARAQPQARGLASSVSPSSAIGRQAARGRALSSSVSPSSALSRAMAAGRALSSSVSPGGTIGRLAARGRALAFSVAHSASVGRAVGGGRALSASLAHTATLARLTAGGRAIASSIGHSASVGRAAAVVRALSSSLAHSAVVTGLRVGPGAAARALTSSITHSVSVGRAVAAGRVLTSSIGHGAVLARLATRTRTLASSIVPVITIARVAARTRTLASSATHSADLARRAAAGRSLTGSIGHSADLARRAAAGRSLTGSIGHSATVVGLRASVAIGRFVTSSIAHVVAVVRSVAADRAVAFSIPHGVTVARGLVLGRGITSTIGHAATVLGRALGTLATRLILAIRADRRVYAVGVVAARHIAVAADRRVYRVPSDQEMLMSAQQVPVFELPSIRNGELLDFDFDFTDWLADAGRVTGDTIASATWALHGLARDRQSETTTTTARVWLAPMGIVVGRSYPIDCTVTTTQGRVVTKSAILRVVAMH